MQDLTDHWGVINVVLLFLPDSDLQDIRTLQLLCPDHTDQAVELGECYFVAISFIIDMINAHDIHITISSYSSLYYISLLLYAWFVAGTEANCVVCDTSGDVRAQLFCTSCGQHYHGNCLDPPVTVGSGVRAGWQCPECKICQTCRQPGDDNKMLVCDTCDKGYHTFCLLPVMNTIPKNGWKCKVKWKCKVRTRIYRVCKSSYEIGPGIRCTLFHVTSNKRIAIKERCGKTLSSCEQNTLRAFF